ncbi:MAG: S16 family serine protease [Nanobdellota archaeon]
MRFPLLLLIFLVLCALPVLSVSDSVSLLSVKILDNGTQIGGTASLSLRMESGGSGDVFIQSFPSSQLDTQTATRIANEIACDLSSQDCSSFDFFYTIKADSSIIGGPSAGGATALLTLALLEDIPFPDSIAMTGAISSGGVITPVSGVKEKISAADHSSSINTVFVPKFSFIPLKNHSLSNSSNVTSQPLNLTQLSKNVSVDIFPISTVREALAIASNGSYELSQYDAPSPSKAYSSTMKHTSDLLCNRTQSLLSQVPESNSSLFTYARDFFNNSKNASSNKKWYSRASYCYTANLRLRQLLLQNTSQEELKQSYDVLYSAIERSESIVDNKPLSTFSDLEAYVVVKERLLESKQYLDEINTSNISTSLLAYALERQYSAVVWSSFFGLDGPSLQLDTPHLKSASLEEIHNAEVRYTLLRTMVAPSLLSSVSENINQAQQYFNDEEYALALFKASKAKAHSELFISTLTLPESANQPLLDVKLNRTAEILSSSIALDRFPILGYSYYEYSQVLAQEDPVSALLFTEYALHLSDVSGYFPQESTFSLSFDRSFWNGFIFGSSLSILVMLSLLLLLYKKKR